MDSLINLLPLTYNFILSKLTEDDVYGPKNSLFKTK